MFRTRAFRIAVLVCMLSLPVIGMVGCGVAAQLSLAAKVLSGKMDTLTGTEIMAVRDAWAPEVQLNQEQANAIAQFLADNHIATIAQLEQVINQIEDGTFTGTIPPGFVELFTTWEPPTSA